MAHSTFVDGSLDALVGIRDHQLDPSKTASGELAQELSPDRLGFRRADLHAQNLTPAVGVDGDRDDRCDRDDATTAAHLEVGGIDPQIRPVAFYRPRECQDFRV